MTGFPTGIGPQSRAGGLDALPARTIALTAHGSRDPRAAATIRAMTRAVAAAMPEDDVVCAFLDFESPRLGEVLAKAADRSVVVPLLLTPAYHARVDIPAIVDAARSRGAGVEITPSLGQIDAVPTLAAALQRRLPPAPFDAVVVAAAGSRDESALVVVDEVASELSDRLGVPCRAGYASGVGESVRDAVFALRRDGARSVGLSMYFIATGVLSERAAAQAADMGVIAVSEAFGAASEIVALIVERVNALALVASR